MQKHIFFIYVNCRCRSSNWYGLNWKKISRIFIYILKHLCSVFTEEKTFRTNTINLERDCLNSIEVNSDIIKLVIDTFNNRKSSGPDNIYDRLPKEGKDSIVRALCIIFKRSLDFTEIPVDWELANVIPIFKGNKQLVSNYRPTSLASVVS